MNYRFAHHRPFIDPISGEPAESWGGLGSAVETHQQRVICDVRR
jgi:hypothetical protein